MGIETLVVGHLQTNCYLLWDQKTRKALILDPGDDADLIINRLRDLNLIPAMLIATHGHFDHLLAVNELKSAFDIPLYLHPADTFLAGRLRESAFHWLGTESGPPPTVDRFLKENDRIIIDRLRLTVIETPGHTPGSISLYSRENAVLFSGDTLFNRGIGRTDLAYSSPTDLQKSLEKLFKLPADIVVFPGHGETTIIGTESAFFRGRSALIRFYD